MAYQDNNARPQRQMINVSSLGLACSECGVAINELPFEPTKREDGTFGKLYCYDCNKKRRKTSSFGGGRGRY